MCLALNLLTTSSTQRSLLHVAVSFFLDDELAQLLCLCFQGGSRTPAAVRLFIFFLLEEGSNGVTDSYGSTEFPGIASNGEIAPDVELKLIPCQGGYTPDDRPNPRGEILVRRRDGSRTSYVSWNLQHSFFRVVMIQSKT